MSYIINRYYISDNTSFTNDLINDFDLNRGQEKEVYNSIKSQVGLMDCRVSGEILLSLNYLIHRYSEVFHQPDRVKTFQSIKRKFLREFRETKEYFKNTQRPWTESDEKYYKKVTKLQVLEVSNLND